MLIRAVKHRRVTASFIAVLQNTALTQEDGYVRTESWQCLDPLAPSSTATLSWGFTNNHVYMEGSPSCNIHGAVVVMCKTHDAGEYSSECCRVSFHS